MKKQFAALAAAIILATPAAAFQSNVVHVDVSAVADRLGLDLAAVELENNVVQVTPPVAATACGATTSELSYQAQQGATMRCKAKIATKSLKKAAKAQAKAKAAS